MKKKNLFIVITTIFFLFHINNIKADKSEIPLCYQSPEVFDKNLVSYEEYILNKCFSFYKDHIEKGEFLDKKQFLNKIENDKAFERFIYLYVLIKEYWHAQKGTLVDLDYTMNFDDSLFKNYLIWGAQNGNQYGRLIQAIEWQTYSVDEEILESIKNNKYSQLYSFDMGEETYTDNQKVFFEKYSVDDFADSFNTRLQYLSAKSQYEESLNNKIDPEKHIASLKNYETGLPEGFYSVNELSSFMDSAQISIFSNNYAKAQNYINGMFEYVSINVEEFPQMINYESINPYYFDVFNFLCEGMSYIFLTDAYFEHNFDYELELNNIDNIYQNCFKNIDNKYAYEGEKIYWGLIASWYKNYEIANELLFPSKYPKHFGDSYAKSSYSIVPSFFNYAALASLEKGNIDQAEEFLFHAIDAYEKNERDNNFQWLFTNFIKIKIVHSRGKYLQSYKLLDQMREDILFTEIDFGNGYFTDEDIDAFINEFLDLTFKLKTINEEYFVDPLFLFELKNIIFQSDNLLNLRKDSDEGEYNILLEKYENLREEKIYLENKIFNENNSSNYKLSEELASIEKETLKIRTEILNLKENLRIFFGASKSTYLDLQENISSDDIVVFNNFAISGGRTVFVSKSDISLRKIQSGRNKVRNLILRIRKSLEIEPNELINNINEYDFVASKELYDVLFKNTRVKNYKNIYTFSNEILNSLPMQILVSDFDNAKSGWEKYYSANWLNKKYNFAILETLVKKQKNKEFKKNFLGFGDPDLSNNPRFADIPNTKQELIDLALASGAKPNDLFMRKEANYENFINVVESESERVVIASHGFPPSSIPETSESGIILSGSEENSTYITASEIAMLDIKSDWIVLSACNTGFNNLNYTKNYSSLAKAFLAAGAESVLVSNWSIETNTSAELTKEIFNSVWFDTKVTKHQALNQASEKLRNNLTKDYYVHPSFWGAFSLVYDSI